VLDAAVDVPCSARSIAVHLGYEGSSVQCLLYIAIVLHFSSSHHMRLVSYVATPLHHGSEATGQAGCGNGERMPYGAIGLQLGNAIDV